MHEQQLFSLLRSNKQEPLTMHIVETPAYPTTESSKSIPTSEKGATKRKRKRGKKKSRLWKKLPLNKCPLSCAGTGTFS